MDASCVNVLLIEDNPGDARLIREMLREARGVRVNVHHADRLAAGLERLAEPGIDVLLLDLSLPDSHGLETFTRAHAAAPRVPIVVLSGLADETLALRAVQEGAQDYLLKGQVESALLARSRRYAIERQRAEAERDALRRELERQKDRFFANISHDLRTPLAAIKASIGVVLANEPPNTPEPVHRMLVNIDHAADEMATLVADLLELTRLQAGRVQLRLGEFDLRERVRRVVETIEPLAAARGQRIEVSAPEAPCSVLADASRLERALTNLLANATKYGREGGRITLCLKRQAGAALIAVHDDGPGIPGAERERIFERFYRSDETGARRPQGSGLGLPIARALIELHGGRLWVESEPGEGSTFWIALPLSPAAPAEPAESPIDAQGPTPRKDDAV